MGLKHLLCLDICKGFQSRTIVVSVCNRPAIFISANGYVLNLMFMSKLYLGIASLPCYCYFLHI